MKKRYNKLVAYLLMDFSTVGVGGIIAGLIFLFTGNSVVMEPLLGGFVGIVLAFLLTLYINSRTPKGERVGTWFRAWWLGFKIAWKIALCCTLILIPAMLKWSINISSNDLGSNWSNGRKYVYDENGNKYEVINSEHVKDESGNWHKVWTDSDNNPFIEINGSKNYLK